MQKLSASFDQAAYWRERHRKLRGDPRAAGNISSPPEDVLQRKIVQAYFFAALVRSILAEKRNPSSWLAGSGRRVLDIGFGTGFLGSLLAPDLPYAGYDLSEIAMEDAARMCPEGRYSLRNIAREPAEPAEIIIASEVLFHIVDDGDWRAALRNIARALPPDGIFFFTETFVERIEPGPAHFKPRTRVLYEEALEAAGLRFLHPGELRLADIPVFNQYPPFLRTAHFVRAIPR